MVDGMFMIQNNQYNYIKKGYELSVRLTLFSVIAISFLLHIQPSTRYKQILRKRGYSYPLYSLNLLQFFIKKKSPPVKAPS